MRETSSQTKRHVRVERGIFKRETADGVRYEFNYTDSSGATRWSTVRTLKEAREGRATKLAAVARGERIVPTKVTVAEYAPTWLASQSHLRKNARDWYRHALNSYIIPKLGRLKLSAVTTDDVAALIAHMREQGYAAWTINGTLTPLRSMYNTAVRRGLAPVNPVRGLTKSERPKPDAREPRFLSSDEIGRLVTHCPPLYRALIATALFTGTRQGETLALRWSDIDLDAGVVRVRRQLLRDGTLAPPKTKRGSRDVTIFPALVALLREHRKAALARGFARPDDFVFASAAGGPWHYRNVVRRGLDKATEAAGVNGDGRPRLRWHDLRHTYASLLIGQGENVVYVSRQLGHADASITLKTYAHLFDAAEHARRASDRLEAGFAKVLQSGTALQPVADDPANAVNVALLRVVAMGGN
jgi:integrase